MMDRFPASVPPERFTGATIDALPPSVWPLPTDRGLPIVSEPEFSETVPPVADPPALVKSRMPTLCEPSTSIAQLRLGSICAVSPGPGKRPDPPVQFAALSQSPPLGPIQLYTSARAEPADNDRQTTTPKIATTFAQAILVNMALSFPSERCLGMARRPKNPKRPTTSATSATNVIIRLNPLPVHKKMAFSAEK